MSERKASRRGIIYAFLLVIGIMLAITSVGLSRIQNLSTDLERIVQEHDVQIALMHSMRTAARERSIILQSMMIINDPFTIDDYAMQMSSLASQYLQAREALLQHRLSVRERQLLEEQHRQTIKTGSSQNQVIDYIRNENYLSAATLLLEITLPGQRRAMGMMDTFIALKREQNLDNLNATSAYIGKTYRLMILLGGLGVLFSIGVASLLNRRIDREIELRQGSEQELRHSELRERTIRENMIDGVLTLDARGTILSCNKAGLHIFGYQRHELLSHSAQILMPEAIIEQNRGDLGRHLELWERRMVGTGREVQGRRRDGTAFSAELDITKIILDGEPVYIAVVRDITEKKEAEEKLLQFNQELERRVLERTTELANTNDKLRHEIDERVKAQYELTHLATHDSLTELPNRAMFNEHLEIMVHSAQRHHRILALFFMDLDGFKEINDSHGHEVGDKLLIEIAGRLRECVRKEDIVARMGGDEFTVLLGDLTQTADVNDIAQKLIESVNRPVRIGEIICHVGISIGICLFPRCASDADSLLRLADDAMYAAKEAGKNTYSFSLPHRAGSGQAQSPGFL